MRMGRRKQTPPAPVEPEDESQEPLEDEDQEDRDDQEEPGTSRPGGTIKKTDAVRQALAAGFDSPGDGVNFIRRQFGIEMQKTHFSAVKSQLKKREGEGGGEPKGQRGPKGRKPEATEGYLAPPPKPSAGGQPDLLAAMEAMKPLVASLGKDQVKRIIDLLG